MVDDSILSITPTLDRTKELEMFNLLSPMLGQPPEVIGKIAKQLVKLYGKDYRNYLPENFLAYFKQVDGGTTAQPQMAAEANQALAMSQNPEGGAPTGEPLTFEQQRAPQAVTNVGGQKDGISANSQMINKATM